MFNHLHLLLLLQLTVIKVYSKRKGENITMPTHYLLLTLAKSMIEKDGLSLILRHDRVRHGYAHHRHDHGRHGHHDRDHGRGPSSFLCSFSIRVDQAHFSS